LLKRPAYRFIVPERTGLDARGEEDDAVKSLDHPVPKSMWWMTLALYLLGAFFLGCEGPGPKQVTQQVGAAGGTLTLGDTTTLVIPPGALSETISVTLSEGLPSGPPGYTLQSSTFVIEPKDLLLSKPATLTVPIWGGAQGSDSVALFMEEDGGGVEGVRSQANPSAAPGQVTSLGRLSAPILHFGTAFVATTSVRFLDNLTIFAGPTTLGDSLFVGVSPSFSEPMASGPSQSPSPNSSSLQQFILKLDTNQWSSSQELLDLDTDEDGVALLARNSDLYLLTNQRLIKFANGMGPGQTVADLSALSSGRNPLEFNIPQGGASLTFNDAGIYWLISIAPFDTPTLQVVGARDGQNSVELIGEPIANATSDLAVDADDAYVSNGDGGLFVVSLQDGWTQEHSELGFVSGGLTVVNGQLLWFDNSIAGAIRKTPLPLQGASTTTLWTGPSSYGTGLAINMEQTLISNLGTDGNKLGWIAGSPFGPLVCQGPLSAPDTSVCALDPASTNGGYFNQGTNLTVVRNHLAWNLNGAFQFEPDGGLAGSLWLSDL
jgi:hypothetical protein